MGSIVAEIADKIASAGGGERSELEVRGGTGADGGGILTLSTSELTVVDGDKLGRIDFQAPLESGTDAIVVSASIWAEADDTFAADNNSTELVFAVGASEAAAEKMRLTHDGELGIGVATPASLLHVAGTVQVGVDDTGHDVKFFGATAGSFLLWDESDDALELTDSSPIRIGDDAAGDMTLYHDGTDSYITNKTGALKLATETSGIAVTIGHTTSEVTIGQNLSINGLVSRFGWSFGGGSSISGGVLGVVTTAVFQYVDTQSAASTDDLDTINGGFTGQIVIFMPGSTNRTVVVKHGTGNIRLNAATDFSLDAGDDRIMLYYNGSVWLEISRSSNG